MTDDDILTGHEKQLALKAEHAKRRAASSPAIQEWPTMDEAESSLERFMAYLHETFDAGTLKVDAKREERPALPYSPGEVSYTYHVEATFRSTGYARQFLDTVKAAGHNSMDICVTNTGFCTFPDGRGEVAFSYKAAPDADPYEYAIGAFRAAESPKPAFGGLTQGDHDVLPERYGDEDDESDEDRIELNAVCPECGSENTTEFSTGDAVCEDCNHNWG